MRVIQVGPLPPPVHGMANVNIAMSRILSDLAGVDFYSIDTSSKSLDKGFITRFNRMISVFCSLAGYLYVLRFAGEKAVYLSVSGGYGKWYELLFVLAARCFGARIVMHHHCFSYLNYKSFVASCLFKASGPQAIHVVLSAEMGAVLSRRYGVRRTLSISNAAFMDKSNVYECKSWQEQETLNIGYISNISSEKGIFEFMELCEHLHARRIKFRAIVAGPFVDGRTEHSVTKVATQLREIEFVGAVFGEEKREFYRTIDILCFPTKYKNEAEPLVVLEALASGVPVMAFDRGSIAEVLCDDCGCVVPREADFAGFVAPLVYELANNADKLRSMRMASLVAFENLKASSKDNMRALLGILGR